MAIEIATVFPDQVSISQLLQNLVYASGVVGAIFVVVGLLLIDNGGSRAQHAFNSGIEKVVGFFIGFSTYFLAKEAPFSICLPENTTHKRLSQVSRIPELSMAPRSKRSRRSTSSQRATVEESQSVPQSNEINALTSGQSECLYFYHIFFVRIHREG